jgi:hypothetical protein
MTPKDASVSTDSVLLHNGKGLRETVSSGFDMITYNIEPSGRGRSA